MTAIIVRSQHHNIAKGSGMVKKAAIGISTAVTIVVAAAAAWLASGGYAMVGRRFIVKPHYERRVSQFEQLPVQAGDTVFLGDSLTEFGLWDDLLPETDSRNRGILGDDASGVLARLSEVTAGKPSQVFLMVGTNDLGYGIDEDEIVANVEQIVSRIATESPDTEIYVQSVLPRTRSYRDRVESLNRKLRPAVAGEATWIDLYPHFVGDDGSMSDEYSNDQVHLLGDGYLLWRDIVEPYVKTR